MKLAVGIVAGLLIVAAGIVAFFVIGLRTKHRAILGVIRRINRVVFNPRQMKTAGTLGAYASIVRHVGRTSGRPYETPIVVRELNGDFVVVLPYATQADWYKNLMAAGSAELVTEGVTWRVTDPELVTFDSVSAAMTDKEAASNRMTGARHALRLHRRRADDRGSGAADRE